MDLCLALGSPAARSHASTAPAAAASTPPHLQTFDFTALAAATAELSASWVRGCRRGGQGCLAHPLLRGLHSAAITETPCIAPLLLPCCLLQVPAKVEGVVQQEVATALRLRTATDTAWLWLSYHARYAHVGIGEAPPRGAAAELYSFGAQLQAALRG